MDSRRLDTRGNLKRTCADVLTKEPAPTLTALARLGEAIIFELRTAGPPLEDSIGVPFPGE